jgi:Flp pilus assembly protein TadB
MTRVITGTEAALRSGATLSEALRREASASTEPLARDAVQAAIRAFDLGASLDTGLRSAAGSLRDRRMALVLETLGLAAEERLASARVADLLAGLADRLTFEERLEDEVRARASGARQQQKLLALLVPAIAIVLIGSMPALATALDSTLGRFVLIPGAVALEVAGVVLARGIVNEALT